MTGKLKFEQCRRVDGRDGRSLTLVEQHHDFVERVHEVHVLVAVFLDLQNQSELRAVVGGECLEELRVVPEVAESLVGDQLFLLVPFAQ